MTLSTPLSLLVVLTVSFSTAGCGGESSTADASPSTADASPGTADAAFGPYFDPCSKQPDSCTQGYQCTTTVPAHPDQPIEDVCMLPCDTDATCPAWAGCICQGGETGRSDAPIPDGFCTCV